MIYYVICIPVITIKNPCLTLPIVINVSKRRNTFSASFFLRLKAERFSDEDDFNSSRGFAQARMHDVRADTVGAFAVGAGSRRFAGRAYIEALRVDGSRRIARAGDRVFGGLYDFVHAARDDDAFRAESHRCNSVAVSVDVDDFAVFRNRVRTRQIRIAQKGAPRDFDFLFLRLRRAAVDDAPSAFFYAIYDAERFHRHGAAPGYDIRFRYERENFFGRLRRRRTIISVEVPKRKRFYEACSEFFVSDPFRVIHKILRIKLHTGLL